MKEVLASIDLGSNTFHILIVKVDSTSQKFEVVHRQRDYVFLSKEGVKHIGNDSYKLGIETLKTYRSFLDKYKVAKWRVIGTETLRIADNGANFVSDALKKADLDIEIIDGITEAKYIYNGVKFFLGETSETYLIMDIGGGSVEFVIFNNQELLWSHSFAIGISVLYNQFQKHDPILKEEILAIREKLNESLMLLNEKLTDYDIHTLVGSAGSFEIVKTMLEYRTSVEQDVILVSDFKSLYNDVINLNHKERVSIPGLPIERVRLMPMAITLLDFVLDYSGVEKIICSPYSLKEGVIYEMLFEDNLESD